MLVLLPLKTKGKRRQRLKVRATLWLWRVGWHCGLVWLFFLATITSMSTVTASPILEGFYDPSEARNEAQAQGRLERYSTLERERNGGLLYCTMVGIFPFTVC